MNGGSYNVKIRFCHQHKVRYISTHHYVSSNQIEPDGTIINHPSAALYNIQLRNLTNLYEQKIADLGGKVSQMDMNSIMNILRDVDQDGNDLDFMYMAKKVIDNLHIAGRVSYAKSIEQTIDHLKALSGHSLLYAGITPEYLERFEMSLKSKKKGGGSRDMSVNAKGVHLRNIRMIYNKAIDAGKVDLSDYPFRRFKIKQVKSMDKDMDIEDLRALRDADLTLRSHQRARDLFMLSFYMCGMNFKDLLYAKKSDVKKGRLVISRAKTDQPLSILILSMAQQIIDKYTGDKYLLSFLEDKLKTANKNRTSILYKDITDNTSAKLRKIAEILELPYRLSTYFARYTWSSIAFNECGVSEEIIGLALGHASPKKITAGYIRKKYELVDLANEAVIAALR